MESGMYLGIYPGSNSEIRFLQRFIPLLCTEGLYLERICTQAIPIDKLSQIYMDHSLASSPVVSSFTLTTALPHVCLLSRAASPSTSCSSL
jgi:hypothetical protein